MNELDEFWSEKLSNAIEHARDTGREDIADYLALKVANDAIRQSETDKLFQQFTDVALSAENFRKNLRVERESPHRFVHRNANMTGMLLRLTHGVRCLTVEAGWTRTPSDGFIRLGALVFARITHFGMPDKNVELALKPRDESNLWFAVRGSVPSENFGLSDVERHLQNFLDDRLR